MQKAAEEVKENLDSNKPNTQFCFIQDLSPSPSPQPLLSNTPSTATTATATTGGGGTAGGAAGGTVGGGGQSGSGDRRKACMSILNPDSGVGERDG